MKYLLALLLLISPAFAQEEHHHGHPPQDQEIHERFYSTWMMPDAPRVSCCSNEDCKPAASKFENGQWFARFKEEDAWVPIPASKVEENRESPDGRSHMCGRAYADKFVVFCFVRGGGV